MGDPSRDLIARSHTDTAHTPTKGQLSSQRCNDHTGTAVTKFHGDRDILIPRAGPTLEKRTFHSFRHTFAKRALESSAQITWLSRHLGHSSLKVTTDIYGHWERAERKIQAAKMEGAFPV